MYEFTEDCMIHIEEIDNEHRRLFQMINEAIDLAAHTEDVTTIADSLLPRLKEYAATHFAHEEPTGEHQRPGTALTAQGTYGFYRKDEYLCTGYILTGSRPHILK